MFFLFLILILLLFITSKIEIQINELNISSKNSIKKDFQKCNKEKQVSGKLIEHLDNSFNIKIKLKILKYIPIISTKINKEKILNIKQNTNLQKITPRFKENINFKTILKHISKNSNEKISNNINIEIKKFNLNAIIGTEIPLLTVFLIPIICTILSIYLSKKQVEYNKIYYKIQPNFHNQNILKLQFNGIFEVKMIHIIKVICIVIRKRRVDKNERASNRRSYDYSYE